MKLPILCLKHGHLQKNDFKYFDCYLLICLLVLRLQRSLLQDSELFQET